MIEGSQYFSGLDLVFPLPFIHQVLKWASIFKGHLTIGLKILWDVTKFLGELAAQEPPLIWPLELLSSTTA